MRKLFKALLCSFLSAIFILGCLAFPIKADTMPTIEFDEHLHVEKECNGVTKFRLKIPRSTMYYFKTSTNGADYDPNNVTGNEEIIKNNPICHVYKDDGTEMPMEYRLFWKPGLSCANSTCYLVKGEYILIVQSQSFCDLRIDGFDSEVYVTKNGQRMDYIPIAVTGNLSPINYIYDNGDNDYKLVVNPSSSGNNYQIYTTYEHSSKRDLDETVEIPIKNGELDYIMVVLDDVDDAVLLYYFWISPYSKTEYEYPFEKCRNFVVDKMTNSRVEFKSDYTASSNIHDAMNWKLSTGIVDMSIPIKEPIAYFADLYRGEVAVEYFFIKETSTNNKISLGKTYEINPKWFSYDSMDSQVVYSFTPEKDEIYNLSSTGWDANPYVAVFDSSDNCIGWNAGNYSVTDINYSEFLQKLAKGEIDHQINLNLDLKAGQTYYFYFTNALKEDCYYNSFKKYKDNPYSFKLMVKSEIVPDSKPDTNPSTPETPATPSTPTTPSTSPSVPSGLSFEDFVERLYVVALGRQSEPEGKAFWCEHVGNGDLTGAACANEFLLSKEFNDRNLSNEDFLKVLYKTFFDRDAANDPDGFNFWMNSLKTEGRDKVVDGFINSTEWCNICASYGVKSGATRAKATIASKNATDFAERLYSKCLGRQSEEEGLKFWSLGLTNLELTGSQAAHEFFYSKEFLDHNFDNKEYLTRMYKTFMGRDPDEDGMNYWLNNMNNGMTRDQVFNFFVESNEFTEICKSYAIER